MTILKKKWTGLDTIEVSFFPEGTGDSISVKIPSGATLIDFLAAVGMGGGVPTGNTILVNGAPASEGTVIPENAIVQNAKNVRSAGTSDAVKN